MLPPAGAAGTGLDFSSLLNGGGMPPAAQPAAPADPATRFASQLQQLEAMGFTDRDNNLRILQLCNGNVNLAVERLLSGV